MATKNVFGEENNFQKQGGIAQMGRAMKNGMVLVMSIWDDHDESMLWLDSTFPAGKTSWGGPRGSCSTSSGKPDDVESKYPNSNVKFSNIRVGDFGSTYNGK
jgi:cellulose 1,4-beta-cellobiosidase